MKPEEQIKALAELDGYIMELSSPNRIPVMSLYEKDKIIRECHMDSPRMTAYLTSYDAIIPLIQKQNDYIKIRMDEEVRTHNTVSAMINLTPSQLCEALLRATENWKE